MIVRLKTLEELRKEFKHRAFIWANGWNLEIHLEGFTWIINAEMKENLGKAIQVESCKYRNYTHRGEDGFYYHELWFELELGDFLKEEEFKI